MTATQFINQYVTGPFVLYRKIDGELLPGDFHDGPGSIPEDADYLTVIEVESKHLPNKNHTDFLGIICRRINE